MPAGSSAKVSTNKNSPESGKWVLVINGMTSAIMKHLFHEIIVMNGLNFMLNNSLIHKQRVGKVILNCFFL